MRHTGRPGTLVLVAAAIAAASVFWPPAAPAAPASPPFSIAFYNIRAGKGIQPLRGAPTAPFADTESCDPAKPPFNAWGAGFVQKELEASIGNDSSVVALGLAEAWKCASPAAVLRALGWKKASGELNGTALLARHGFAGEVAHTQLDTSRNRNPRDTMWVIAAPVCLDARCSAAIDVYATHWSGTGPEAQATFDRQAQDTIAFMARSHGPHVLVGDLNVFEGTREVCGQRPNNGTLGFLRRAGYVDAWAALNGSREGFTGMLNRAGCGSPEGAPWKRIDYAWSRGLTPVAVRRFGVATPGTAAPSDHLGIVAGYRE